ncbi:hypothetical protein L6472_06050 [Prevotella sp. E13-17]|uniref:hypothetical protein n=1 Tax=Prevotella sp. E13-17 TaxID=2913616 RepID=UPI001EDACABF|nr:hypothetical protein [Prevotella sp. E13-17]UKK52140.1 hypothetical protein L6472_06050 [Prevotella sp. E13-17]
MVVATPFFQGKEYTEFAVNVTLGPEDKYVLRVGCPNRDCDTKIIDISNLIFEAVKSGSVKDGKMNCHGHLRKYGHNRSSSFDCDTYVEYRIEPVSKKKT